MTEFKKIYLQPECCVQDQDVGRMWCQDAINDCEEGNEWIEYLLASDVNKRIAELELQLKQTLEHKKCEIERICSECSKTFILKDVQHNPNVQATFSNFEDCPHCHARNDTWVKISWLSK
jgi:hypothetical protein